jgi:cell division GTPase FtsZ
MIDNTEFEGIAFDLPKNQSNVIKVIGVGGGGSNAINQTQISPQNTPLFYVSK